MSLAGDKTNVFLSLVGQKMRFEFFLNISNIDEK
jgi:hypothetical protein